MATDKILSLAPCASIQQDLLQAKPFTNGKSFEIDPLDTAVSTTAGLSHPHHHLIHREPVFIPAFHDVRRAALAHAEQELRGTYHQVEEVDNRIQRAQTWPDQHNPSGSTEEMENLKRKRTKLLDRLVDLISRFGTAPATTAAEEGICR